MTSNFSVAEDFSECVGGRYKAHGDKSGEELREDYLIPRLCASEDGLLIDLEGVMGLPPSFAEEAFGGLVRRLGPSVLDRVAFLDGSDQFEMERAEMVRGFMRDAVAYVKGDGGE